MKKILIAGSCSFLSLVIQAQNIEETTYMEKNKSLDAFGFTVPVCNKDVLVDTWKNFIKKQGGKVKGGIVNKATGSNIKLSPSGEEWIGYFAYTYNENNTLTIFTSFQNIQGDFLTSQRFPGEIQSSMQNLENFRMDILKSCNLDDLNNAKNYSISLSKEKIRNSDRIMFLEKDSRVLQQKIDTSDESALSEKEKTALEKRKQRVASNATELESLTNRNNAIDEELKAQSLVIQNFQRRMDELDGKIEPDNTPADNTQKTGAFIHDDDDIISKIGTYTNTNNTDDNINKNLIKEDTLNTLKESEDIKQNSAFINDDHNDTVNINEAPVQEDTSDIQKKTEDIQETGTFINDDHNDTISIHENSVQEANSIQKEPDSIQSTSAFIDDEEVKTMEEAETLIKKDINKEDIKENPVKEDTTETLKESDTIRKSSAFIDDEELETMETKFNMN